METKEKIMKLISHWLEHQQEHCHSYRRWAEEAEKAGLEEVARHLRAMADEMESSKIHLLEAKKSLEGG